jgi:addiction module RelE/StbE family toxin
MLKIIYAPAFLRQLRKLEKNLQAEAVDKIYLFGNKKDHNALKVHKLKGQFSGCYSFSVNYKYRIICEYLSKDEVALLDIGDHDIYDK